MKTTLLAVALIGILGVTAVQAQPKYGADKKNNAQYNRNYDYDDDDYDYEDEECYYEKGYYYSRDYHSNRNYHGDSYGKYYWKTVVRKVWVPSSIEVSGRGIRHIRAHWAYYEERVKVYVPEKYYHPKYQKHSKYQRDTKYSRYPDNRRY